MKVSFNREQLLSAFGVAAVVAPSRSPKVVLCNVKIAAQGGEVVLMATDTELGVRIVVEGAEVKEDGAAILPVSRFGAILRESADETVSITVGQRHIVVKGNSSEFKLPVRDADEFPNVTGFGESRFFEVEPDHLRAVVKRTLFATDVDSARYALGGVLLEFGEGLVYGVGTDGRRLAKHEIPVSAVGEPDGLRSIVPGKSMQLIERVLSGSDAVKVAVTNNDILVECAGTTVYSRLVDGRFPDWRQVLPERDSSGIELEVGPFLSAVKQASIVASEESRGVDFAFSSGSLVLSGRTAEIGQSRVELPIAFDGEDVTLTFDYRYIVDFLKTLPRDTKFSVNVVDKDSAALYRTDDGFSYVLMPLERSKAKAAA